MSKNQDLHKHLNAKSLEIHKKINAILNEETMFTHSYEEYLDEILEPFVGIDGETYKPSAVLKKVSEKRYCQGLADYIKQRDYNDKIYLLRVSENKYQKDVYEKLIKYFTELYLIDNLRNETPLE